MHERPITRAGERGRAEVRCPGAQLTLNVIGLAQRQATIVSVGFAELGVLIALPSDTNRLATSCAWPCAFTAVLWVHGSSGRAHIVRGRGLSRHDDLDGSCSLEHQFTLLLTMAAHRHHCSDGITWMLATRRPNWVESRLSVNSWLSAADPHH